MVEIVPAILVHSKDKFVERLKLVAPYVSRVQWDIMDGKFVDNTTFSDPSVLKDLKTTLRIEADIMVSNPRSWIELLNHPPVDQLIFHVESAKNWEPIFEEAQALGFAVGIAAEPETPLDSYSNLLPLVDRYQAMGGRSGFGGQEFNHDVLENIKKVRKEFPKLPISVDIGVNTKTASAMIQVGATVLCAGSAIFSVQGGSTSGRKSDSVEEAIARLKKVAENG